MRSSVFPPLIGRPMFVCIHDVFVCSFIFIPKKKIMYISGNGVCECEFTLFCEFWGVFETADICCYRINKKKFKLNE